MRLTVSIFLAFFLVLSACAPGGRNAPIATGLGPKITSGQDLSEDSLTPAPPALISNNGAPYTVGGDARVTKEIQTERPDPQAPLTPVQEKELVFADSLDDFRLFRHDNDPKKPVQFGKKTFDFWLQIKTEGDRHIAVHFSGNLRASGNSLEFADVKSNKIDYSLEGRITDGKDSSIGLFEVRFQDHRAKIFYRAYRAKLTVSTRQSQDWSQVQDLKQKVDRLKKDADDKVIYAWGQNMVVAGLTVGASRFHYDILPSQKTAGDDWAFFSFEGVSVRQGVVPSEPATVTKNKKGDIEKVQLQGDAEDEDSRIFSMTLRNKKTDKSVEVMVQIEREGEVSEMTLPPSGQQPAPTSPPAANRDDDAPASMDDDWQLPDSPGPVISNTPPPSTTTPKPSTTKSAPRPVPRPQVSTPASYLGIGSKAYFFTNYGNANLPLTKRAIDQFEKNYNVRQVQNAIAILERRNSKLNRWFYYASPFVDMIQSIAEAYDVPPAFAFLIVNESEYFSGPFSRNGRHYPAYSFLNPSGSSAIGPFQIVTGTATSNGIAAEKNRPGQAVSHRDERNYFAPSACGAALYIGKNMRMFPNDAALGVMAYFQGEGTVKGLVTKIRNYEDYSMGYAIIARHHMIKNEAIDYVARFLASYFVGGDYKKYGFSTSNMSLPSNAVPASIRSPRCRAAVAKIQTS